MNRDQFEEKRRLLGHAQPTDGQPMEIPNTGETGGEGNPPTHERFFEVTKKYLSDQ